MFHRKELPCHHSAGVFNAQRNFSGTEQLLHDFCCAQACAMRLKPVVPAAGYCDEGRITATSRPSFFPIFLHLLPMSYRLDPVLDVLLSPLNFFLKFSILMKTPVSQSVLTKRRMAHLVNCLENKLLGAAF